MLPSKLGNRGIGQMMYLLPPESSPLPKDVKIILLNWQSISDVNSGRWVTIILTVSWLLDNSS